MYGVTAAPPSWGLDCQVRVTVSLVTSVTTGFCGGPGSWMNSETLDTEETPSSVTQTGKQHFYTPLNHNDKLSLINILTGTKVDFGDIMATDGALLKNTGRGC